MPKNRQLIIHLAIGLGALILGVALGHSMIGGSATSAARTTPVVTAAPAPPAAIEHTSAAAPKSPTEALAATGSRKSLEEILKGPRSGARTRELEEFVRNLAPSDI